MLEKDKIRIRTHDAILAVESVLSEPEQIVPGTDGTVKILIKNMADSIIKDIKVKLNLSSAIFVPIGSTNEKTAYQLAPKQTKIFEFKIRATPDAIANLYRIPVTIKYSDLLGQNYTKENDIGLTIGDEPDLKVIIDESTINKPQTKGTITVMFINKGTTDIKFLYITLKESEDYEILSTKEKYVGNIDSDDYETVDFEIFLKDDKQTSTIPIEIEYRDANNRQYKKEILLEHKIYGQEYQNGKGTSKLTGTIVVLIIIGAGLFLYRRHRKKKKK